MPPKKKLKPKRKGNLRVKVHDIDAMNKAELKYYILKLKSEVKNLRESMHRHTIQSNRLNSFLQQQLQEYMQRNKYDISNNCEIINFVAKFKSQLEEAHCKSIAILQERHERNALRLLKEYFEISIRENGVEKTRIKQVQKSRRTLKEEEILSNLAVKSISTCDVKDNSIKLLDETVLDYSLKLLKTVKSFSSDKQATLSNIYDLSRAENCVFEGCPAMVLSNIEVYFHQLNLDNRKVILELRQKLTKLQEKQRSISVLLDKALEENKSLLSKNVEFEQSIEIHCSKYDRIEHIKRKVNPEVEKLIFRRDELKQKLNESLVKRDNLKKVFLTAVIKFHERGEYRAYVANQALKVTISVQNKYPSSNYSKNREVTQNDYESNNQNLHDNFTQRQLKVQNYDMLCIPPQFHSINNFERITKWIKTI